MDEERFVRGGRGSEERFRDTGRDVRQYADFDREREDHGYRDRDREDLRASPSGRGFGEVIDREGRHRHYNLTGLHDLDDLSELRERYHEHRHPRDYEPHYGHGPGIENMESPRLGYGTSMTRRTSSDREMGHGGFMGDTYRAGSPQPSGRGPKGYQRSDDRIREDICDRLMVSWMNAENVDVIVRAGEVTLQGTVKSRDEKRAIEALAESVLGVKDITNALRLERADQVRAEARPEQLPQTQNLKDRPQAQSQQGRDQERRAKDQEQTSAPQPGDTSLHS
ncbi:MAG: BON domain-containing protein [Hyalangium sp.]|uniref:BON domain-containing protein n=1 Tax=Hyalangium sp. TaxID=2028555 RepID=UPI00389AF4E7